MNSDIVRKRIRGLSARTDIIRHLERQVSDNFAAIPGFVAKRWVKDCTNCRAMLKDVLHSYDPLGCEIDLSVARNIPI